MKTSLLKIGIDGGESHTLFLKPNGKVYFCGYNGYGAAGLYNTSNQSSPVQISALNDLEIVDIAAGDYHNLFLTKGGQVYSCGRNNYTQLGHGITYVEYTTSFSVKAIQLNNSLNSNYPAGMRKNTSAGYVSGYNNASYCQLSNITNVRKPLLITSISNVVGISAGTLYSLFLKSDGTVYGCGYNNYGQLGTNNTSTYATPTRCHSNLSQIIGIGANYYHSVFLKSNNTVWTCGRNDYGQGGVGNTSNFVTPTRVPFLEDIVDMAIGELHSIFLKSDGTVYGCGYNGYGQIGDGTVVNRTFPVKSLIDGVSQVFCGYRTTYFLKSNGTVWACGYNGNGNLGLGKTDSYVHTPQQLSFLSGIKYIAGGRHHIFFIK